MPRRLSNLLGDYQNPKGLQLIAVVTVITTLLLVVVALVYATGGTRNPYPHFAYIPIVLGAFLLYKRGGLITALAAGLLLGPLMPLSVAAGTPQATVNWVLRALFFMLVGLFTGHLAHLLHARLESVSSAYGHTLRTFAALVAYRDEQTAGHCDRVAYNAIVVGEVLGVPAGDVEALYWAGMLHDLGKITVPDSILLKPGRLTAEEYAVVKRHAVVGSDLLLGMGSEFKLMAAGVRSHHERWDGHGYPDGLKGREIPLFGRILAVVDVFEALTSERPYRKPLRVEDALSELRRGVGQHFDGSVVEAFLAVQAAGGILVAGEELRVLPIEGHRRFLPIPAVNPLSVRSTHYN